MRIRQTDWFHHEELLALGVFGPKSRLGDRIEILLRRGRTFSTRASLGRVVASAVVLLMFLIAGSLAPRWIAFAQQEPRPSFEVASIRRNISAERNSRFEFLPGGKLIIRNMPLIIIVATAYNVPFLSPRLTGGPDWRRLAAERYDIDASAAGDAIKTDVPAMKQMLQSLLDERFKLKVRKESKEQPVYALVVAKGGPKLQKSKMQAKDCDNAPAGMLNGAACHDIVGGIGRGVHGNAVDISDVALWVENWADRPILDKTGLTDLYNIQTEGWAPMRPRPPGSASQGGDSGLDNPDRQTLADLFRKLGLILMPQRAIVDMFVIEHVEKPSAN